MKQVPSLTGNRAEDLLLICQMGQFVEFGEIPVNRALLDASRAATEAMTEIQDYPELRKRLAFVRTDARNIREMYHRRASFRKALRLTLIPNSCTCAPKLQISEAGSALAAAVSGALSMDFAASAKVRFHGRCDKRNRTDAALIDLRRAA